MKKIYLCVLLCLSYLAGSAQVSTQLSYFNVTKGGGGPISTTDIIELRAVISVPSGTTISGVRFNGTVPTGTTYQTGSIAAKTNEGLTTITNTGTYTDASGDDRGTYTSSTGTVRINLGQSASATAGGSITGGTTVPRFYSNATIIQATFRVRVNLFQGSILTLGGNSFTYGGNTYNLPNISVYISYNNSCASFDPVGNLVTVETGGGFGSGTTLNRSSSSPYTSGFTFVNIGSGSPQDGQYSIVKSTSYNSGTGRVHGVFDIFGDHTGTSTSAGNPAPNSSTSGGYMLLVNATFTPSVVFSYSVSGLITNMDYTIGFWIRNVCGSCAANPTTGGGGSGPGVLPNLIFSVNGSDRYTTGNVAYGTGWVQHTFTFNSGTNTVANLVIRNNAPGGGGNDWAIDDISLNRCLIILPETVENLSVDRAENVSVVKWNISNDEAIKNYVVEYSEDGKAFKEAGTVYATGQGGKYSFNDTRAIYNKMYYRIKSVTKNGDERYSKTVLVREGNQPSTALRITPNPAYQNPAIQFTTPKRTTASIMVMDGVGRMVSQTAMQAEAGTNVHTLNLKLKPGVYTVVIDCGQGDVRRERMVIIDK